MTVSDYNKKIAQLVLDSVHQYIEQEDKLKRGGGSFPNEKPVPIMSVCQPQSCSTPSSSLTGGKFRMPKVLRNVIHETQHIVAPIAKVAATKVLNAVADKGVNMALDGIANYGASGAGMPKKRGRPPKAKEPEKESGGKFNFIKSLKSVGHTVEKVGEKAAKTVGNVIVNKGIDSLVGTLTNPAVDAGLETGLEVAAVAAGMKKKRKPSRRNILIGQLMKKNKGMTLAQASKYIKEKGLK
jgi:hypothetical protein